MSLASVEEVNDFLFRFKFFAQNFSCFHFVEREKNLQSILDLNLTVPQVQGVILQLTYRNYCSGPEADEGCHGHTIWTFGYHFDGTDIYIKLSGNLSHNIAKCISFHRPDYTLSYPYKNTQ